MINTSRQNYLQKTWLQKQYSHSFSRRCLLHRLGKKLDQSSRQLTWRKLTWRKLSSLLHWLWQHSGLQIASLLKAIHFKARNFKAIHFGQHTNKFLDHKLAITIGLSLTMMVLVASCRSEIASPQMLRVGMNNWIGYAIALYAQDAGVFAKRGLQVDITEFSNQQDNIRSTMRGAQDLSFVPLWEVMQVDQGNDQPVFIMVADVSAGSDGIVARAGINAVKELKGKRVGTKLGTVAHLVLLEALQAHQLQPEDVQIVDVSNERSSELLQKNDLDAAVVWEPNLSQTAAKIQGKIIFTTKDVDSLVIDGLATRSAVLKENKQAVQQFILAWFDAIYAVTTKPNDVFTAIAQQTNRAVADVARDYSGLIKGDRLLNQRMFIPNGRITKAVQESAKLLKSDPRHGRVIREDVQINGELVLNAVQNWTIQN